MKKIISLLLSIIILFGICTSSYGIFMYTDKDNNVSFVIPDGWQKEELNKERTYLKAKFKKNNNEFGLLLYGSYDVYSDKNFLTYNFTKRSEINNSLFSDNEIAKLFQSILGVKISNFDTVTYNHTEYFHSVVDITYSISNISVVSKNNIYLRIANGYLYYFQISEENDSSVIKKVLNSVEYKNDVSDNISTDDYNSSFSKQVPLVILFVIGLFVLTYHIKKQVTKNDSKDLEAEEIIKQKQYNQNKTIKEFDISNVKTKNCENYFYCRKCGEKIPIESQYCNKCGTEVIKMEDCNNDMSKM